VLYKKTAKNLNIAKILLSLENLYTDFGVQGYIEEE
jgi:hypothetical protein